jgi:hypothetical protein
MSFNPGRIVLFDWLIDLLIDWFLVLNATFSNISAMSWRRAFWGPSSVGIVYIYTVRNTRIKVLCVYIYTYLVVTRDDMIWRNITNWNNVRHIKLIIVCLCNRKKKYKTTYLFSLLIIYINYLVYTTRKNTKTYLFSWACYWSWVYCISRLSTSSRDNSCTK